ncbi:MAG: hypothetical protein HDT44_01205 [Ruminococcaceae bacterium]|nr:hypothetical protein [Oscillospiraceae bacterium]
MDKMQCNDKLDELLDYEYGWGSFNDGKTFSKMLIERCKRLLSQFDVIPEIRPTIDGEVAFDYDCEVVGIEIVVTDDKISGFTTNKFVDNPSLFIFVSEEDAVNFWNTFVGVFYAKYGVDE